MNISTKGKAYVKALLWLFFLIQYSSTYCQYSEVDDFTEEYPGENGVISFARDYIEIKVLKDGLSIIVSYEKQATFFNDNANLYSSSEIVYSDFYSVSDIEAYSMVPENGKYVRQDVKEFTNGNDQGDNVFFDDSKITSFYFPNLQKNAQSVLKYKKTCKDPHLLPGSYFASYLPVAKKEVEVCYDKGIEVSYRLFNCDSFDVKLITYSKGNKNYMKWTATHVDKVSLDEKAPPLLYQIPHIILYISSYKTKDTVIDVLSNGDSFFRWSYGFVKDAVEGEFKPVALFCDSLVNGISSPLEKIKKVYSWVQDNIRYVAFEEGYSGFKPRSPDLVLSRRYGDCKDMASLLNKMLRSQNIESYLAWVGTRDLPYNISEIPVPGTLNHIVVVAYDDAGNLYILDPTSDDLIIPFPSKQIQGKELMVCVDSNNHKIITAPVIDKTKNIMTCEMTMDITDGRQISGKGVYTLSGYFGMLFREYFANLKEDEKTKFVKANVAHGNNKFKIESLNHSPLVNKEEPFVNRFNYSLPEYCHLNNNETYVNLNISKNILDPVEIKDRRCGLENDFKYMTNERFILNIPEGYVVSHMPADDKFDSDDFGYSFNYTTSGKQVVLERSVYVEYLILPREKLSDWNNYVKKLNANCSETIVLILDK